MTLAHAFVAGAALAEVSDSERDISVGGTALASVELFDGVHYAALGHLHQAQQPVPGRVAYSGSPLAYSFSEAHHTKSVSVVDLGPDGVRASTLIPTSGDAAPGPHRGHARPSCSPTRRGRSTRATGWP